MINGFQHLDTGSLQSMTTTTTVKSISFSIAFSWRRLYLPTLVLAYKDIPSPRTYCLRRIFGIFSRRSQSRHRNFQRPKKFGSTHVVATDGPISGQLYLGNVPIPTPVRTCSTESYINYSDDNGSQLDGRPCEPQTPRHV